MMTDSRIRGLGRFLLMMVIAVLVVPAGAAGVYRQAYGQGAAVSRTEADGARAPTTTPVAHASHDHPEAATDRSRPRRGARSAAAVSAAAPQSTPLSTAGPVRDGDGLPVSVPLTGHQAVPLSRSGELSGRHHVFRC
ncbi:hypothetical protein AB0D04_16235 [Streptomyces sp. NPDC048483]|uniref:hypothetical protein n=1 Tax=Streptomyces sp. NPDC048483 TaxID=3154927 RepID=UPI00342476E0